MPARETEAIILKTFPLGEADRLVSFLGRTSGRMRGVAGGARRLKNRYGSTLEVLSHVQIWYVEKETRDLVRIQQCDLLESFHKAQSDYGLSTGLAVVSEVSELVLPEHEAAESMFRLISADRARDRPARRLDAAAELLRILDRAPGWLAAAVRSLLRVRHAVRRRKRRITRRGSLGLFCEKCKRPGMRLLHLAAGSLAETFRRRAPGQDARGGRLAMQQRKELREASLELDRASHRAKAGHHAHCWRRLES